MKRKTLETIKKRERNVIPKHTHDDRYPEKRKHNSKEHFGSKST